MNELIEYAGFDGLTCVRTPGLKEHERRVRASRAYNKALLAKLQNNH